MKKLIFLSVMVVTGFLFVTSQALAGPILPLFQTGANQFSDENSEYLIDNVFTSVGQMDIGDSMRGSINFNTLNSGSANLGGLTGNNELTGVFQLKINNIVGNVIDFVPDPVFETIYGTGAIAAMFEDSTCDYAADFNDPAPAVVPPHSFDDGTPIARTVPPSSADVSVGPYTTEEAFISTATNGVHRATIGFLGLPGEGVQSTAGAGGLNMLNFFNVTSGTILATTNLGLNTLWLDPAWDALLDIHRITPSLFGPAGSTVDWAMSQSQRGVMDRDTPFEVSSNTNVSANMTVIPEPATMFLLGSGLVGMAGLARRKRKV